MKFIIVKNSKTQRQDEIKSPLVDDVAPPGDVESPGADPAAYVILRARARRVSTMTTICVLLTALFVVCFGILSGTYLYRQYLRSQIFRGTCQFPYADSLLDGDSDYETMDNDNDLKKFFEERFELDLASEEYEKIDVPDFKDGRNGRFIHDFNTNTTGIIDMTGKRCFIMPLNRDNVLPPKSLYDLIQKMWEGYYKVNTDIVRETMRVVTPPITDEEEVGAYISRECKGLPIYKLEKIVGNGIVKRSAELPTEALFAQYAGHGISEVDIVNFDELLSYEKQYQN